MTYFTIFIEFKDDLKNYYIAPDRSEEDLKKYFVEPFNNNQEFLFTGRMASRENVNRIFIFENANKLSDWVLDDGEKSSDLEVNNLLVNYLCRNRVKRASHVTRDYIFPSSGTVASRKTHSSGNKVFIVHGRDKTPALELKDFLRDNYHLDVAIFDDAKKKKTSPTIIELLEDISGNAGYAFIVATPDDLGSYCKDVDKCKEELLMSQEKNKVKIIQMILGKFKPRARQNVVFEHGLFIGALGRDRVCCLLKADTQDTETDIDGIIYVGFHENIRETFPEIVEKLKDSTIGLIKPT